MRVLSLSILSLALLSRVVVADDKSISLNLRTADELAARASAAKGPAGELAIEVRGCKSASSTTLMVDDKPGITAHQYVVRGKVKYEDVAGDGYLELWNDFGDKGTYFSRTLALFGGSQKLSGTCDWRGFELPFTAEKGMTPRQLTLNVVLPGEGRVTVADALTVSQIPTAERPEPDQSLVLALRRVETIIPLAVDSKGPQGEPALEVHGSDTATTTQLMAVDEPPINAHHYVVRGLVKYDNVVGDAYLELWNDFGAKGSFFSRSLGESGGMRKIHGTSGWRGFELPFYAESGMKVQNLTLNLVLPGKGTVTVAGPLILSPLTSSGEWWTNQQSGLMGGILGTLAGLMGATLGTFAGLGRFRILAMSICRFGLVCGAISLIAGVVALILGQPYHVYYLLLIFGLVNLCALGANLPTISRRFREQELRRMHASDVVGSI